MTLKTSRTSSTQRTDVHERRKPRKKTRQQQQQPQHGKQQLHDDDDDDDVEHNTQHNTPTNTLQHTTPVSPNLFTLLSYFACPTTNQTHLCPGITFLFVWPSSSWSSSRVESKSEQRTLNNQTFVIYLPGITEGPLMKFPSNKSDLHAVSASQSS
jgi:hypothetical protein